jgi:hypothetical protein
VGLIFAGSGARDSAHPDGLSSHFGAVVMVRIFSLIHDIFLSSFSFFILFAINDISAALSLVSHTLDNI